MAERKPWFMNIRDKINLNNGNYCPPHWIPHKIPVIETKVTDEPCHIHEAEWRMLHHRVYCQLLKCPHYNAMMIRYREMRQKGEI